jgi:hypothetical protein
VLNRKVSICVPIAGYLAADGTPNTKTYKFPLSDVQSTDLYSDLDSDGCADIYITNDQLFDTYQYWRTTRDIKMYPDLVGRRSELMEDSVHSDCAFLLGCYELGKRLEDKPFQDAVLSKLIHCLRSNEGYQDAFVGGLMPFLVGKIIVLYGLKSPVYKLAVRAVAHFASVQQMSAFAPGDIHRTSCTTC